MKKYDLKVKSGKKIIFRQIFTFSEEEFSNFIEKIIRESSIDYLFGELENVFVKQKGQKWYSKEFPYPLDNPKSLSERKLKDIASEYPEILVAAMIQQESYEMFEQPNYEDDFSFKCQNIETLVSHIGISSVCEIIL